MGHDNVILPSGATASEFATGPYPCKSANSFASVCAFEKGCAAAVRHTKIDSLRRFMGGEVKVIFLNRIAGFYMFLQFQRMNATIEFLAQPRLKPLSLLEAVEKTTKKV